MAPCRVRKWGAQNNIWMSSSCIRQEPLPARGLGLSTGRWVLGVTLSSGILPSPSGSESAQRRQRLPGCHVPLLPYLLTCLEI